MPQTKYTDYLLLGTLLFFLFPMVQITVQYMPYYTNVGFLQLKQQYLPIQMWKAAFFIHVYSSMLVLFAGFTQFSSWLLKYRATLHRLLGYLYVLNILCITGPASIVMGWYANGGVLSRIAFLTLSGLWIGFTFYALWLAKQKKYQLHKAYMIRSYALTLSAITLRAWKYIINHIVELPQMDVYRIIAWAGWVINLLVAEWYIRKKLQIKH